MMRSMVTFLAMRSTMFVTGFVEVNAVMTVFSSVFVATVSGIKIDKTVNLGQR